MATSIKSTEGGSEDRPEKPGSKRYYIGRHKPVVAYHSETTMHWTEQLAMRPKGQKYGTKQTWPEGDYIYTDEDLEEN